MYKGKTRVLSFPVDIKWTKQVFKDIELDTKEDPDTFKTQLYALTTVPIEKQKVLIGGKVLKTDTDWSTLKLKEGMKIMLMGTAEGKKTLEETKTEIKFVEDMTPEERARFFKEKTGEALPAGLVNLGNTCYMNSVL